MAVEFVTCDKKRVIREEELSDEAFTTLLEEGWREGEAVRFGNDRKYYYLVARMQHPYMDARGMVLLDRVPVQ